MISITLNLIFHWLHLWFLVNSISSYQWTCYAYFERYTPAL